MRHPGGSSLRRTGLPSAHYYSGLLHLILTAVWITRCQSFPVSVHKTQTQIKDRSFTFRKAFWYPQEDRKRRQRQQCKLFSSTFDDDQDNNDYQPRPRPPSNRKQRQPQAQQQRQQDPVDSAYWDDDEEEPLLPVQPKDSGPRMVPTKPINDNDVYNGKLKRSDPYSEDEEDEEEDDYYYEDEEEEEAGNFWSNPPARYDPVRSKNPRQRVPRDNEPPVVRQRPRPRPTRSRRDDARSGQRRRKSTFRSGTPPPPPVVGDFYKQLFWYGFNPDDSASPADKTMFGGTKGKFNGLAFLYDEESQLGLNPSGRRKGKPRQQPARQTQRRRDDYYDDDFYDDDYYNDEVDEEENFNDTLDRLSVIEEGGGGGGGSTGPPRPFLEANIKEEYRDRLVPNPKLKRKRRPRQRPWEEDDYGEDDGPTYSRNFDDDNDDDDDDFPPRSRPSRNWASSRVSSWFRSGEDELGDKMDMEYGSPRRRPISRKKRSGRSKSPPRWPWEVIGEFFDDIEYKAEMYDRQIGTGGASTTGRGRQRRRPERRDGYAYRYDVDMDEYASIVDADIIIDDNLPPKETTKFEPTAEVNAANGEAQPLGETPSRQTNQQKKEAPLKKEPTWEERALARDRIPPPDVPAWGPSGDLGMDARMKAYLDAVQDVQEAQYRLADRKKREQEARDDITILKVDVGVKKRRLAANKREAKMLRDDIRSMELEIEEASRSLRKAIARVQFAEERLSKLEDRHREVLRLCNPSQAQEVVADVFREFAENEPAARLRQRPDDITVDAAVPQNDEN